MAAAALRQAITRVQGAIKEAVHVKISPRPRNLAESREVLRILQRYGEVAVYKHLKVSVLLFISSPLLLIFFLIKSKKERRAGVRVFFFFHCLWRPSARMTAVLIPTFLFTYINQNP